MARNLTPKYKLSRREGIDIHPDLDKAGTAKSPLSRKQYAPGVHGFSIGRNRVTNYGKQLREKQKTKRIYGILERQFSNYFKKALRRQEDTGDAMLSLLESRLDNVVYRLGFAKTRPAARQLVNHGQVLLNDKKNTIPSANVTKGSTISLKESFANSKYKETLEAIDRTVPHWLKRENTKGTMITDPDISDPKTMVDARQIVEFYSK